MYLWLHEPGGVPPPCVPPNQTECQQSREWKKHELLTVVGYTGICSSGCRCRLSLSTEKMMTVWTKISFHFCKACPMNTKRLSVLMTITAGAQTKQQHCYVHEMVRQILATESVPTSYCMYCGTWRRIEVSCIVCLGTLQSCAITLWLTKSHFWHT